MALAKSGVSLIAEGAGAFFSALAGAEKASAGLGAATAAAAPKVAAVGAAAAGAQKAIAATGQASTAAAAGVGALATKFAAQQKELAILGQELTKVGAKYGESSTQAQRKQLAIDKLKTSIAATEAAIKSEAQAHEAEAKAAAAAAAAEQQAATATQNVGQAAKGATPPVKQLGDTATDAGGKFSAMGQATTGALREIGAAAVSVAGQAVAAFGSFVAGSVTAAGDFESNMAVFGSVAGDALGESGKSLDEFKQLFISLGTELPVSTAEVQQAAIELAKGGIDPATIAAGGLRTALDLAAAGGVGLADSATIMAKQLGVWVDGTADAATKAAFLAQTADLLSQSANATTSDVSDLALGLSNVGGTAKTAGLSFQETVTGLSILAPGFDKASSAGISFKEFIARLIPSTKPATEAMIDLGLATEDGKSKFYDAEGSFIGLKNASELLRTATAGLSEEQKSAALRTIFGSDAINTAAILAERGAAGYDRMTASLASAGSVQEQAKARQVGFNTALDNAKGSLEALQLTIGGLLLPILTTLLSEGISPLINAFTALAGGDSFTAFTTLAGILQPISPALAGIASDLALASDPFATLVGVIDSAVPGFGAFVGFLGQIPSFFAAAGAALGPFAEPLSSLLVPALVGLAAVLGGAVIVAVGSFVGTMVAAAAPVLALAAVAGVLYAAWQSNFGGIQGIVTAALSGIAGVVSSVLTTVVGFWTTYGGQILATATATWTSIQTTVGAVVQAIPALVGPILAQVSAFWATNGADILATVTTVWGQVGGIVQAAMGLIQAVVPPVLAAIGGFISQHGTEIQAYLTNAWTVIKTVVTTTLSVIQGVITAATAAIQGNWSGAWEAIKTTAATLVLGVLTVVEATLGMVVAAFEVQFGEALGKVLGYVVRFNAVGRDLVQGIINGIKGAAGQLAAAAAEAAAGALQAAKNALSISSPSAAAADQVGTPFSQGIAVGITAAAPDAFAAAEAAATGTITAAQGIIETAGPDIGSPLTAGLAEGVTAGAPAAETSIQKTLQSIIKAAQSALKISGDESQEAAVKVGEPFAEGVASGIADAAPAIERAADAFGKVGLESIPASFAPALDASTEEVAGFVPQFGTAGKNLIGGMKGGVEAAAGALAKAAAAAAKAALDAAKGELGIASPSAVAEEEVGSPFVAGIVAGIANSLDTVKAMARHLSKQLTEDMKKVAEEAANAFKAVLQAELEADAGFAGTRLDIFRAMRDLGKGSELADAKAGIGEAEQKLKEARDKQLDIDEDYNDKTKDLNDDFNKIEKERADAIAKIRTKRGGDSGAAEAEIDTKRDSDIAMIDGDTRLTRDVRDKLIADVRAQAEAEKAAARARAASLQTDAGYQKEIAEINEKYDEKLGEINDKLFEAKEAYDEQSSALATQLTQLQTALDLARARVLVEQELDERRRDMVGATQRQLDQAASEADQIRAFDPAAADAYYQLRSKQILDLAKLEQDSLEALRAYRLSGTVEDRDALGSIDTEKTLLAAQQAAERALFAANAKANSPYAGLTNEITALQQKLTAELQRDQGFYNLTDKNNLKMREKIAREIAADQNAIAQINALLEQVGAAAMGGGVAGIEGGAPGLIAAMQAAFEEAKRATEAQLGISSPSKVFALDVGLPVAQGIAQGISKGQGAIENALAMSVSPPNLGTQTVRPAMTAQQQASSYQYNQQSYGSIGTFNAQAGVTRGDVQAMITQAFDRSGRTAYTRRATA